jgi:hypothetical protein
LESVKTADLLAGSRRTIKILLQVKALRPLSSHDPAQTSLIKFAVGAGVVATVANQNKPVDRRLMGFDGEPGAMPPRGRIRKTPRTLPVGSMRRKLSGSRPG